MLGSCLGGLGAAKSYGKGVGRYGYRYKVDVVGHPTTGEDGHTKASAVGMNNFAVDVAVSNAIENRGSAYATPGDMMYDAGDDDSSVPWQVVNIEGQAREGRGRDWEWLLQSTSFDG